VTASDQYASVRYIVDDVQAAVDFYTSRLGFTLNFSFPPALADVVRGPLRLLLSGPASSGARATPADAAGAGRNRIHLVVDDLDAEIIRLRDAGLPFPGRRRLRPWRTPDPAGRPGRQSHRAVPVGPAEIIVSQGRETALPQPAQGHTSASVVP
jgi:catechol 2,3-dioxygenase-like lactoylglutathione lyase family enzyme